MKIKIKDINLNDVDINLSEKQRLDLIKTLQENKTYKGKPDMDEEYYLIDANYANNTNSGINHHTWVYDNVDNFAFNIGNVFLNQEDCVKEIVKLKAIQRVKNYIIKNNLELTPNWEESYVVKYYIAYNYDNEKFTYNMTGEYKHSELLGFFESDDDVKTIIKNCEKDLNIIFDIN